MRNEEKIGLKAVPVWDLPVRLFHWSLVGLVLASWVTSQADLDWYYDMDLHMYCGYAVLTLLIFRLLWGFWGSQHACFRDFVCGFRASFTYAKSLLKPEPGHCIGHNPLGAWSVLLLLTALFVQAGSGLFASDEILAEGPLYEWVSSSTSEWLTKIHKLNFFIVLLGLVILHISAMLFYLIFKKENLVRPMVTGRKWLPEETVITPFVSFWRAIILLGLAYGMVHLLVFVKW